MKERLSVSVPSNFGAENMERLKARLPEIAGDAAARAQFVYDDSLLGGFIVRYQNRAYDASLKSRLEQVRSRLVSGD